MKIKLILTLLTCMLLEIINCYSQSQFQISVSGTADEWARSVVQTTDGGYVLAGTCTSFGAGGYDIYIIKLNQTGSLQWTKTIGGTGDDIGHSIILTRDGGYAIVGSTTSFGAGGADMYIIKLNNNGNLQWNKIIGGSDNDNAYSILQTIDGSYLIAGYTLSFGAGNSDV